MSGGEVCAYTLDCESVLSREFTAGVQGKNMHGWAVPRLLVSYSSLSEFVVELRDLHFLFSFNNL
jgi:hypothetical protein